MTDGRERKSLLSVRTLLQDGPFYNFIPTTTDSREHQSLLSVRTLLPLKWSRGSTGMNEIVYSCLAWAFNLVHPSSDRVPRSIAANSYQSKKNSKMGR